MGKADGGVEESHHICATVAGKDLFERLVNTVITKLRRPQLLASTAMVDVVL